MIKIPSFSLLLFSLLILTAKSHAISSSSSSILQLPSDGENDSSDLCSNPVSTGTCPIRCFRPDPVCGEDGVTYWCGCADAHCAGTRVAKLGFCQVGNGGSGPLSGQALLLVHMVWLIVLGFSLLCGLL